MGFRFRRSIRLGRGLRINLTKKGVSSVSIGHRGATINLGPKGEKATIGLPGTGLSYSQQLGQLHETDGEGSSRERRSPPPGATGPARWKVRLVVFILLGLAMAAIGAYRQGS